MRLSITAYGQQQGDKSVPAVPDPVHRMVNPIIQSMAIIMRSFSIATVKLELVQSGMVPVSLISFKPLDDEHIPVTVKDMRPEILRGVLRTVLERFGLSSITISLDDNELNELREYWNYLESGQTQSEAADIAELEFDDIELPVQTDPGDVLKTDKSVEAEGDG